MKSLKITTELLNKILAEHGFYKYRLYGVADVVIKIVGKKIHLLSDTALLALVKEVLRGSQAPEYKVVYEAIIHYSTKRYINYIKECLQRHEPYIYTKRDIATAAFTYFKNCFVRLEAGKAPEIKYYSDLNGYVWSSQVIDFDFTGFDHTKGEFETFLCAAITGRISDDPYNEVELHKLNSVKSAIGYMLHRYKNAETTKAVIFTDAPVMPSEIQGQSGKSLIAKALGCLAKVTMIDGPNFKPDYDFAFQSVRYNTDIINLNDVGAKFKFSSLYSVLCEDLIINKKGVETITIPFLFSPKMLISCAADIISSKGESNKGRQHIIEFSNFWNYDNPPAKHFGHLLFADWDKSEWERFYTFCMHCIIYYLENGLIDFPTTK